MSACFIFGALPVESLAVSPKKGDFVIAADKGVLTLKELKTEPDVIIGDFDSLGFVPEGKVIKLPVRKDKTDIGYAVDWALGRGFREFFIYGGFGGLLDHTVANLQICADIAEKGGGAFLFGKTQAATVIKNGSITLRGSGRISVFAFGGTAGGVNIKGLSYELENACLEPRFPLGVSNAFTESEAEISVERGALLIIYDL